MAEEGSLRRKVVNALKLHRDGRHEEALWCASQMLTTENHCALLMNLIGDMLMDARSRVVQKDPEMGWKYLMDAVKFYELAVKDAPNCIHTSANYAAALLECHDPLKVPDEFLVGVHTICPDDPYLHHASYALDRMSKEGRMQCADEKWAKALTGFNEYISKIEIPADESITNFFTWMESSQSITGMEIFAYAENLSRMYRSSARARYLPNYVVLHLIGTCYWSDDKKSAEMLDWAAKNIREEVLNFSRSLVFSLVYVKLLLALGKYDAAEKECYRALEIEEPDDPLDHEIPLGSTSGQNYSDRVSEIKNQIRQHHQKIVLAAQYRWRIMKKDLDDAFLSMNVEDVTEGIDQSAACTISEALRFFESNRTWNQWLCPYMADCGLKSTNSVQVYNHLVEEHHLPVIFMETSMVQAFEKRLAIHQNTLGGHDHVISFSGKPEMLHFQSFDDMFQSFFLLSNGDEKWTVQDLQARRCRDGAAAIETYKQDLIDLIAANSPFEVEQSIDLMEKLWVPLLQVFMFDYRDALLPLLASLKWDELKKGLEDVTAHGYYDRDVLNDMFVQASGTLDGNVSAAHDANHSNKIKDNLNAGATESKTLETSQPDVMVRYEKGHMERDVPMEICNNLNPQIEVNTDVIKLAESAAEETIKAKASRLHLSNQATRHGFEALHRPMRKKVISSSIPRLEQIHDEDQQYCRSNDRLVHQEYYRIFLRAQPLHACSICFFELNTIKPVKHVLCHYQTHGKGFIKCELCSARFATEALLLFHNSCCHEPPGPLEKKRFRWSMKQGLVPSSRKEKEKPG